MSPSATMPLTQQAQDLRFKSLNIGIVGAGIAGLGAAIALSQSGHSVELFERSRFANEVGAAIHVCPNAARVLEHWGFDFKRANALEVKQTRLFVGDTLEISSSPQYPNLAEKYGAPWYFLHRVDLHNELKRLAQQPKADSKGAKINLSSEVVDTDCENGLLTLANGVQHQKDLIIAADGIHSQFIKHVVGKETPASPTGMSAFRFLIPTEKLVQNPMTRDIFNDVPNGMNIAIMPDRRLVWYPCRGGELQNFVGIHPDQPIEQSVEDWNVDASVEDLLATYTNFAPVLQEVCKNAEDLKLWKLLFRYPVSTWVKGRVLLIGDAAHPMLPHQGQAGGQAIEDGAALGVLFANIESAEDIPRRLAIFQDVRKGRASAMQLFSNAGQDEAEKIEAEAKQYVPGGRVPKTPAEFIEYNFAYDILKECARALATDKIVPEDM